MSEPKRATLVTLNSQRADEKKQRSASKTTRFTLTLHESTEKSCPEFNYRDLLKTAEKKTKPHHPAGQPNGLNADPFGDDDDEEVKRLARQYEERYRPNPQKKRRNKRDDYADIGAGYDETDSFIDNTDAYDEMVPADVTTLHDGFYINSGSLVFKQVEYSDNSDLDPPEKPSSRKRAIRSSDESDSEREETDTAKNKEVMAEKKQKVETNGIIMEKPIKKKLPDDKEVKKKKEENKKKAPTVKELLREKRIDLDLTIVDDDEEKKETVVAAPPQDNKESDVKTSNTINDIIESVINAGRGRNEAIEEVSKDSSSTENATEEGSTISSESESSRDGTPSVAEEVDRLPDNLPKTVLEIISNIKKASQTSEGKVKFFSGPVNTMLLNLERQCQSLGKAVRNQVYQHLSYFVKCKKDTLMRRAKNLLLIEEKNKIKEPIKRLRSLIDRMMPAVLENYEKEYQRAVEKRLERENVPVDEENKSARLPRKRFPWTEEMRKTLEEIIMLRRQCFEMEKTRKDSFDNHLEIFIKTEIIPLWPDNWMSLNSVYKQCRNFYTVPEKPRLPVAPSAMAVHQTEPPVTPTLDLSSLKLPMSSSGLTVTPITQSTNKPSPPSVSVSSNKPTLTPISASVTKSHVSSSSVTKSSDKQYKPVLPVAPTPVTKPPISISTVKSSVSSVPITAHKLSSSVSITANKPLTVSAFDSKRHNLGAGIDLSLSTGVKHSDSLLKSTALKSGLEICAVSTEKTPVTNSHLSSVSITSIDRSNIKKDTAVNEPPKPISLKHRILNESEKTRHGLERTPIDDDIIDLTETFTRAPTPKNRPKLIDSKYVPKKLKLEPPDFSAHKPEEITCTEAINRMITESLNSSPAIEITKPSYHNEAKDKEKHKSDSGANEEIVDRVMKGLKELQQLQEYSKRNEPDLKSSSPVSVIAYNSSYSPSKTSTSATQEKKPSVESTVGFQDAFQRHVFQESLLPKQIPSTSTFSPFTSSSVQQNNYNSVDTYPFPRTGNHTSTAPQMFPQNSMNTNNFIPPMKNAQQPTGTTNDDFMLFPNFLYEYGFQNLTGSKQKSSSP